ncbi:DEAD/DEAH box helicase [Paenisporosarcina cavernae]|uniref:DEAD/DEAH box helicase n=1 Tax=Paenisporosarcina cavernae TaxID=2320858 RepID=A0A385YV31_9BACL|nr:DEAD/DEAH box helicase [Paenisporosarcina cavernae]AYC29422.1 DEAD/DEAH box helicase [Paenisporosarcina cavernae]
MFQKKTVVELIEQWKNDPEMKERIVYSRTLPEKDAIYVPFPSTMHPKLIEGLHKRSIHQLYSHQAEAFELASQRKSFTAITPTASGKSFCYHLPVLHEILENPTARALYLFPTKALAQDQKSDLHALIEEIGEEVFSYTYDGDTAPAVRTKIRKAGHIVLTNPDMLHSGILPHHTKWVSLFENLSYIVIDELHTYKGVFGSHVSHVIRRLKRICAYYGSNPTIICTSATIANPKELAEQLTNTEQVLIERNGAPSGNKHFLFLNPPLTHPAFGIRRSAILEVRDVAEKLYKENVQTIIFAKSRVRVEMLVTYLKEMTKKKLFDESIRGYRGGYLPSERRVIEKGLRTGDIKTVVSTNALELGIDIGQLQACVMTGYPGTIASAWQQAGRAGRRQEDALIIYVAGNSAIDQYVIENPSYLLNQSPEEARIQPDNLFILMDHLKCASFELPFSLTDTYGEFEIQELLTYLEDQGVLVKTSSSWHWMSDRFPAHDVSLRSATQENVVIIDQTIPAETKVIGEMDTYSAMTLLHDEAIYMHQGTQFQVEYLDWEEKKAFVREVDVDYYTDANLALELKVMAEDKSRPIGQMSAHFGDISVVQLPTIFKKIRFETHDNIGSGPISLPPMEKHTSATWLSFEKPDDWNDSMLSDALIGVGTAISAFVPMFVQCDRSDIHVVPQVKAVHSELPTIFISDSYPGGIGISDRIYDKWEEVIEKATSHVEQCSCEWGCPACIGAQEAAVGMKDEVISLFHKLAKISR